MMRSVATLGPIGHLGPTPGTLAAALAIPAAWLLHWAGGFALLAAATVALFALAFQAAKSELARRGPADPREFVVDEVVGQWLALWPLSAGLSSIGAPPALFPWPGWVGAFLLFRLLGLWKPGPIGRANARRDVWGVMLDDTLAGVGAAVVLAIGAALAHLWLLR